jgi:hypothetical protein
MIEASSGTSKAVNQIHYTTQNGCNSKLVVYFSIFHLILANLNWLQLTETEDSETLDKPV